MSGPSTVSSGSATSDGDGRTFGYAAGWTPLAIAIVIALVVETAAAHLLVSLVAPPLAFVFSALSIATLLWLVGDAWAAHRQPIVVGPDRVELRIGWRWRAVVPRASIVSVGRPDPRAGASRPRALNLAMDGQPNVEVALAESIRVRSPLGQGRPADRLLIGVDDPASFIAELTPSRA